MKRIRIQHLALVATAAFCVWALDFEHARHQRAMERAGEYAEAEGHEVTGVACVTPTFAGSKALCASFPRAGAPLIMKCEDSFWRQAACETVDIRESFATL